MRCVLQFQPHVVLHLTRFNTIHLLYGPFSHSSKYHVSILWNNGASSAVFTTHVTKDAVGTVQCPVLRWVEWKSCIKSWSGSGAMCVPLAKPLVIEPTHSAIAPGLKTAFFYAFPFFKKERHLKREIRIKLLPTLLYRAREGRRRCSEGRDEVIHQVQFDNAW